MARCSVEIDHVIHGRLRCAAENEPGGDRCAVHQGRELAPEPPAVPLVAAGGGCLVWQEPAEVRRGRRSHRAREPADAGTGRGWWIDAVGVFVDPAAWLFLQRHGRPRPAGTYQGCRTPGCVAPVHAVEPDRRPRHRRSNRPTAAVGVETAAVEQPAPSSIA